MKAPLFLLGLLIMTGVAEDIPSKQEVGDASKEVRNGNELTEEKVNAAFAAAKVAVSRARLAAEALRISAKIEDADGEGELGTIRSAESAPHLEEYRALKKKYLDAKATLARVERVRREVLALAAFEWEMNAKKREVDGLFDQMAGILDEGNIIDPNTEGAQSAIVFRKGAEVADPKAYVNRYVEVKSNYLSARNLMVVIQRRFEEMKTTAKALSLPK